MRSCRTAQRRSWKMQVNSSTMAVSAAAKGPARDMSEIRVLIAEDQQLVRRAFSTMLSIEPDIKIVAQAADGAEAIQLARQWRPDIVLMDLQMPRVGGIGAMKRILEDVPDARIIVLTTFDTDELVFEAISASTHAYLLKDSNEAEILETIRAVHAGQSRLSPKVAGKVMEKFAVSGHRALPHSTKTNPMMNRSRTGRKKSWRLSPRGGATRTSPKQFFWPKAQLRIMSARSWKNCMSRHEPSLR